MDEKFSPSELNQTDFGRMHFNVPAVRHEPETVEELASILEQENSLGRRVKVRNTGHSVNGQTLTDGVQISLSKIKGIEFNKEKLEVRVSAGDSWDEMLKAIDFPNFSPPIFPQNPEQQIHVTGTIAVGGIGIYSTSKGGFWNHVKELTVVTMTGKIVKCSPDHESDIFYYSLGGFGRIGVIAEAVISIRPSCPRTVILALAHHSTEVVENHLKKVVTHPELDGVIFQRQLSHASLLEKIGIKPYSVIMMKDVEEGKDIEEVIGSLEERCGPGFSLCVIPDEEHGVDFTFHHQSMSKKEMAYYYPRNPYHQLSLIHPWSDYIIPMSKFGMFVEKAAEAVIRHGLTPYLTKESVFHGNLILDWFGGYVLKNSSKENKFPLSLELQNCGEHTVAVGVLTAIPQEMLAANLALIEELTSLLYEIGGKLYLYGTHSLTKDQVRKHFGEDIIKKWNSIKQVTDPKNLLNIGVIEHLDDWGKA